MSDHECRWEIIMADGYWSPCRTHAGKYHLFGRSSWFSTRQLKRDKRLGFAREVTQ